MTLCLSHKSALAILREASASPCQLQSLKKRTLPSLTPSASDIKQLNAAYPLLHPVHVLVTDTSQRRALKGMVCHTAPEHTLPRHILETAQGLLVEGPELYLLHAARELPLPRLLEQAFELCGGYRLNKNNPRGFVDAVPLTSRTRLEQFAATIGESKGSCLLKRALAYVCDGSRSPMETVIVLLLCLPPRLGGYGLPLPQMNYRVDVTHNGRKISSNRYFVCDAFWPDAWLDVEYDSDLVHTGSTRIAHDAKRRNGLTSLGVTVITVTRAQALNCDEMDRIAHAAARLLGVRLRRGGNTWIKARAQLRRQLLHFGHQGEES